MMVGLAEGSALWFLVVVVLILAAIFLLRRL